MKNVIIVSKCLEANPNREDPAKREVFYHFHYQGVFAGDVIKRVILKGSEFDIKVGEEYLIYVELDKIKDQVITGKIHRIKLLDECWDRV